jgi:nucleoid-associated protein YgaU
MRKDVKIGLGIGGVLLAVLIVYLLVPKPEDRTDLARSDDFGLTAGGGAESTGGATGSGSTEATTPAMGVGGQTPAEPARDTTTAAAPDQVAAQPPASSDPGATEEPTAAQAPKVDWETVLATGIVPEEAKIGLVAPTSPPDDIFADRSANTGNSGANEAINWNPPTGSTPRGNTPAPTTPASPPAATGGNTGNSRTVSVKEHVVQQGENLSMIAAVAYGDAKHYREILKANPGLDERKLRPGTILKMPDPSTFAQPKAPQAQQAAARQEASIDATTQYRVQQGDSLHRIALKLYGKASKADALYEANKDKIGDDSSRLKLNMVLKLPEPPSVAQSR